jgi:hypothetical protein
MEQYRERVRQAAAEGVEVLKQVLPEEEADLVDAVYYAAVAATLWEAYGYGEEDTPADIRADYSSLRAKIDTVKAKHKLE